ncbi:hypothetical protein [Halocatena marina]|uniref:hypothetical protein n=1 Tax=Halocatena marina TaxID=2934937 RepID=UPI00200EEA93|nr:hypothetical protein [Halocatena marina]
MINHRFVYRFFRENNIAAENEYCGELTLTDISPANAEELNVEITVNVDENRQVMVELHAADATVSERIPLEELGYDHEFTRQVAPGVIARDRRLVPLASRTGFSDSTHGQSVGEVNHTPPAEERDESVTRPVEHPPTFEQTEARQRYVKQLIPVRDSIARTLTHVTNNDIRSGIEAIARQFMVLIFGVEVGVQSPQRCHRIIFAFFRSVRDHRYSGYRY